MQHPLLTGERTTAEIDFILAELALPAGARLLDVGCGFGRHSIELARRGFDVTGIDPAAAMIGAARERARDTAVSVTFQQIPAEQFAAAHPFDAAICLFTTLGQIAAGDDNRGLLHTVYHALKPGGQIVIEVPQRDTAAAQLKPAEKFGGGERYTAVTKNFDPTTKNVTEKFLVVTPEQKREYRLRYHLFSFSELSALLTDAGFEITAVYGNYAGAPLAESSPIMLVTGQKRR